MSKKKEKKKAVYKDTFTFRVFPEYKYTLMQNRRFNLFQGRVEHYKKVINYADEFDEPNKINLVYMIGWSKNLKPYVEKTTTNVVILAADIPLEVLKTYDDYWMLNEKLKKSGYVDKETDEINESYFDTVNTFYEHYGRDSDSVSNFRYEEDLINRYKDACVQINKAYKRYIIVDKLHPEKTIDHKDLDKIIKRYFPFGREQCGVSESACKFVKNITLAAEYGASQDLDKGYKLLGIPDDEKKKELLRKNIKRCDMNINTALRENGHVTLTEIYQSMKSSPYGWSDDPLSSFCLAYALSLHYENHWIYNLGCIFSVEEQCVSAVSNVIKDSYLKLFAHNKMYMPYTLISNDGWRLANRFALIFDIEPVIPVVNMGRSMRKVVREYTRIPISIIDESLTHILNEIDCLIDTKNINAIIKYFDWDKCKKIHDEFIAINDIFWKQAHEKYPSMTEQDLWSCTNPESGWLWYADTFWGCIDKHMREKEVGVA